MLTQFHLTGKGYSGRAVRVRELSPEEVEENLTNAAKLAGEEATIIQLKKLEWRKGSQSCLVEFSEVCTDPMAEGLKWIKVTQSHLDNFGKYFKAKDQLSLEAIYRENHEVTQSELDEITKKGLPVAEA